MKKAGEVWGTLDADEKKKWETASSEEKKKYERDYAAYKAGLATSATDAPTTDAMPVEPATAVA